MDDLMEHLLGRKRPNKVTLAMEEKDTIFSDINETEVEGSYFQKLFTSLIDVVISILLIILIYRMLPREISINLIRSASLARYIFIILMMTAYRFIFLLVFNKTIGMMICSVKYLNADFQPLSVKEKILAVFVIRTNSIKYYKNN